MNQHRSARQLFVAALMIVGLAAAGTIRLEATSPNSLDSGETMALASSSLQYVGPYYTSPNLVGGQVEIWQMATDTGMVGDVVYVSAAGSVRRATSTTATHLASIGVIVGGASTLMKGVTDSITVAANTRAALPGAAVMVLRNGRAWMRADTGTGGTIAAGSRLRPPTYITGRAYGWALVAADSNKPFGTAMRAATPGNVFLADITAR